MAKGSQQTGTLDKTTEMRLPSWYQPYVQAGLQRAQSDVLNTTPTYYGGNTVVGPSADTTAAMDMMRANAMAGQPGVAAGQGLLNRTLGGEFLAPNPYLNDAIGAAIRPAAQQYALANATAAGNRGGRYGGGVYGGQAAQRDQSFARAAQDTASRMAYQNYGDERTRQMQALNLAPEYAKAATLPGQMLAGVGQMGEGYQQRAIADQVARHNFAQEAPYTQLQRYMGLIGGVNPGQVTTTSQPIYENKGATAMGMAGQGAMMGSMLGPWGTAGGAALGGLYGWFG